MCAIYPQNSALETKVRLDPGHHQLSEPVCTLILKSTWKVTFWCFHTFYGYRVLA